MKVILFLKDASISKSLVPNLALTFRCLLTPEFWRPFKAKAMTIPLVWNCKLVFYFKARWLHI